jgi:hypothetical protein
VTVLLRSHVLPRLAQSAVVRQTCAHSLADGAQTEPATQFASEVHAPPGGVVPATWQSEKKVPLVASTPMHP